MSGKNTEMKMMFNFIPEPLPAIIQGCPRDSLTWINYFTVISEM